MSNDSAVEAAARAICEVNQADDADWGVYLEDARAALAATEAAIRADERDAVVAWLREQADDWGIAGRHGANALERAAVAIERGDHVAVATTPYP